MPGMRSMLAVALVVASCDARVGLERIEPERTGEARPEVSALATVGEHGGFETPFAVGALEAVPEPHAHVEEIAAEPAPAGVVTGTVLDVGGWPIAGATIVLRSTDAIARLPALGIAGWVHPLAGARLLPQHDYVKFGAVRSGVRHVECGLGHCGVDVGWERGTVVHAAADGTITRVLLEDRGEAGRAIAIDHAGGLRSYYLHLDEVRGGIEVGHPVRAGEPIGTIGETGAARGPHLHFAISEHRGDRSWYLDPEPILAHAALLSAARSLDPIVRDAVAITTSGPRTLDLQSITTDSQGRFRIPGVTPGNYVAVALAPELAPSTSPGFTVSDGGETGGIAITLRPGTIVEGRVLGRAGPITGATITAIAGTGESAHEVAASHVVSPGDYALRALTGTITFVVTAPGHSTIERTVALGGQRKRREDFVLVAEDAVLRGQVLAADGGAPGAVSLRVIDGPTRRRGFADANGRFEIPRVATGSYVVEVASNEHPAMRVRLDSDRFTDIRLSAGGGLRCELRDAHSGAPLANIRVDAAGPDGATAFGVTDAQGVVELRALAVGEWTLRTRAAGYGAAQQVARVRPTRVPGELRIDLARAALVEGVVRDRHGRRVPGAKVSYGETSTTTDAHGVFTFPDIPAGSHVISAESADGVGSADVQLRPGDERRSLTIELR